MYLPRDPARRIEHLPGERMRCDLWFTRLMWVKFWSGRSAVGVPDGPGEFQGALRRDDPDTVGARPHLGPLVAVTARRSCATDKANGRNVIMRRSLPTLNRIGRLQ